MTEQQPDLVKALGQHKDPFLHGKGEEWDEIFKGEEPSFSRGFYAEQADEARKPIRKERAMRCAHGHCRTSLTDETAVYCPHALPFCENCTWEEACDACNQEAVSA